MSGQKDLFAGSDYVPERDNPRLGRQIDRIKDVLQTGQAYTLGEFAQKTGDPEASISAQLRHLRKEQHGSHDIRKRHRGDPAAGLYEYWRVGTIQVEQSEEEAVFICGTCKTFTFGAGVSWWCTHPDNEGQIMERKSACPHYKDATTKERFA